jgi:hypothetical protein
MTMAEVPSWETVLHTVEQDVLRTEALFVLAMADLNDPLEAQVASVAKRLAVGSEAAESDTGGSDLPPLGMMPLVPTNLLERVQAMRMRISQVRAELELAMAQNRKQFAATTAPTAPRTPASGSIARFIDTTA